MIDPAALYAQLMTEYRQCHWGEAQALIGKLLPLAPQHAGVYSIAGMVCAELQQFPQALVYLRRAAELDPSRADFATVHAKTLLACDQAGAALVEARRAWAMQPSDAATCSVLGIIFARTHAEEYAVEAFRRAVLLAPDRAADRYNLATALVATGNVVDAEAQLEACIRLDPEAWKAHLALTQLQQQTPTDNRVDYLLSLLMEHQGNREAVTRLNMALAKAHEDLGAYPAAFEHMIRGKAAGRSERRDSNKRDQLMVETLVRTFSKDGPAPIPGNASAEPIFIIGMPRSGTSLVERILSSHPDVYAAGELHNFAAVLQQASGSDVPFLLNPGLADLTRTLDWERLGSNYIESTRPATASKPRFVDKLPHNFLYAGFIANALPNAKVICLRRNPMDTCLSNFRLLFGEPSFHLDYSFDLLDTGRYFILFDRLMKHWHSVFPGRIREVSYESLVESQKSTTAELLAFCGLPWTDACMAFHANPSPVATASALQVRRPLFRSSIHRWKNYESELSGLRQLLRDAGIPLETPARGLTHGQPDGQTIRQRHTNADDHPP